MGMHVHFWGTRGSLPASVLSASIEKKIRLALAEAVRRGITREDEIDGFLAGLPFDVRGSYGCNTSCVQIQGGPEPVLCDSGTGLRDFGGHVMKMGDARPRTFHIFQSHLHCDHIMGFPFFVPAFVPGHTIHLYGFHESLESAFRGQQEAPYFPLRLSQMAADIRFHHLELGREHEIAGLRVTGHRQGHPGDSFGYRFEKDGRSVVYSTDSEHQEEAYGDDYPYLDFVRGADLLVFDAQYDLVDHFFTKKSWGHSSNLMGIELACRASVKRLVLFHNEHTVDDHGLQDFLEKSRRYKEIYDEAYPLAIDLAYDGLGIDL